MQISADSRCARRVSPNVLAVASGRTSVCDAVRARGRRSALPVCSLPRDVSSIPFREQQEPPRSPQRPRFSYSVQPSRVSSLPHDTVQQSGPGWTRPDEEVIYYFAYGANMNIVTLRRRGVTSVASRDPARVVDPSVRLRFKHRGGYATLETVPTTSTVKFLPYDAHVHGVLYCMTRGDLRLLQAKEGGYSLQQLDVETYDGKVVRANVFVSGMMSTLEEEVNPTESYMMLLRDGAAQNYLDPVYQGWLSGIETVPSAGLGPEYWNTPSKYVAYSFLLTLGALLLTFVH